METNEQEIINTITTTQIQRIEKYVELYRKMVEARDTARELYRNDMDIDTEEYHQARRDASNYETEAYRIEIDINDEIRKLTHSQWLTGFWEIVFKKYNVGMA